MKSYSPEYYRTSEYRMRHWSNQSALFRIFPSRKFCVLYSWCVKDVSSMNINLKTTNFMLIICLLKWNIIFQIVKIIITVVVFYNIYNLITIFRTALTHFSALCEHKTDGKVRKRTHWNRTQCIVFFILVFIFTYSDFIILLHLSRFISTLCNFISISIKLF